MKHIRYRGEFVSRKGVMWLVEIAQEADIAFSAIGSLEFESGSPLLIEWRNESKEKVICGSTATLQIISPGDRTYEDLYTIEMGSIRLDVYRNREIYWSGTLDTEFYEEPYEQEKDYTVSLTFSDFGCLDRLKFDMVGMNTLYQIANQCLVKSKIISWGIDESLISTAIAAGGEALKLADLKVRSDNFYDEDGEANTLYEVLEGILQPLALRIIQRAGKIYIYDINGLYTKANTKPINWDGNSSTMATDVVYNNAKITWSAYAQSGNLSAETCWTVEVDPSITALNNLDGITKNDARYYSYHYSTDLVDWIDVTDSGFTIWVSKKGENATLVSDEVNFFKIVPQYDGAESEGVAMHWKSVHGYKTDSGAEVATWLAIKDNGVSVEKLAGTLNGTSAVLFKSNPVWIPPVDSTGALLLRATVDLLMDCRFNPFESATNLTKYANQKDWHEQWGKYGNLLYIPVTIKFKPEGSDTVYCWTNKEVVSADVGKPVKTLEGTYGKWTIFSGNDEKPNAWGYLCYYDSKDRAESSGVLGWRPNRPAINPHTKKLISVLENAEAGQYIPYPIHGGKGGTVWIEVRGGGWIICDGDVNLSTSEILNPSDLWKKYSWILMKLPKIEIVNKSQFEQTIDTGDVEYSAEINAYAKESIEMDTICGSSEKGIPTARGAYFNANTGAQIKTLTRAGRTAQIEDLLIGTLYSQFARRRTTLSGEVEQLTEQIVNYTEANQVGKLFMLTSDEQNAIADTSVATFVEFRPDEYVKRN